MNGIEPPTPMSTGSVPSQASVKAARAASYAGPVASIWVASPVSTTTVCEGGAPRRRCFSRWAWTGTRRALAVVSPGATRSADPARAAGTRVLQAPSTLGASKPVMLSGGLGPEALDGGAGADPLDALGGAGLGTQPRPRGSRRRRPGRSGGPAISDVAGVVVQAGDQPAQGHDRVGDQAAPHAGVHGVGQGADLDVDRGPGRAGWWSARARRCPSCRSRRSR